MYRKYLFFDLDGTLTDSMPGITRSVRYALERLGIEVPDLQSLVRFVGPPLKESFMTFYGMTAAEAERAIALTREYCVPRACSKTSSTPGSRSCSMPPAVPAA